MRMGFVFSLLFFALNASAAKDLQVRVPLTSPAVMIDGAFSKAEWEHAAVVEVPGIARLYFQRSDEFVYVAAEYTHSPSGIVDLYISAHGEIYDLHASAKLGERQLHAGTFPEWTWWNNNQWVANVSRIDSVQKGTFLPAAIREYQIRRSRFASSEWWVRFELTAMSADNKTQSVTVFPSDTTASSNSGWLVLSVK
jgi:hypothetical protein